MRWHSAPAVVGAILTVVALHVATRLLAGPALGVDDAEQALFGQALSANYRLTQPPLYTWLVVALDRAVGLDLPTLALLRASILATMWLLLYALARQVLKDPRLAALSAASYALIFKLVYEAQTELSHTLLGAALIAATLVVFAALVRKPTTAKYLLLGAVLALGLLAKWSLGIFVLALAAAALLRPDLRVRVLDPRIGLTLLVAGVLIAPSAIWVATHWQAATVARVVLASPNGDPFGLAEAARGLGALLTSALVFPQPFLIVFLLLFGGRLTRSPIVPGTVDARFLASVAGLALIPFALMVPLFGVASFPERWMLVALLPLPIVLFALVEVDAIETWRTRAFLGLAMLALVLAASVRIGSGQLWQEQCSRCRTLIDFAGIADELRRRGFDHGTIVVAPDQFHLGGNLRLQFPSSRVLEPQAPVGVFPAPTGDGQCLLVRRADSPNPAEVRDALRRFAAGSLGVPPASEWRKGRVRVPTSKAGSQDYVVDFERLSPGAGDCR